MNGSEKQERAWALSLLFSEGAVGPVTGLAAKAQSALAHHGEVHFRHLHTGGDTGQHSIRNGLYTLWNDPTVEKDGLVLIHDGVRPLINGETISRCIACAQENGNAITVTAATETVINVTPDDKVAAILDRSACKLARAPQTFRLRDIVGAHQKAETEHLENMIDSAMLMSHYGFTLHTVDGPAENIKITTPPDYYIFRAIYEAQENSQIWGL